MVKPRQFVKFSDCEIVIRLTAASVRDFLGAMVAAAEYNAQHAEEPGSPEQKDQELFARVLRKAQDEIYLGNKKNWKNT
jgi:hypothetical protein